MAMERGLKGIPIPNLSAMRRGSPSPWPTTTANTAVQKRSTRGFLIASCHRVFLQGDSWTPHEEIPYSTTESISINYI